MLVESPFKKTEHEKAERAIAMENHRDMKKNKPEQFEKDRRELTKKLVHSGLPKWGSIIFKEDRNL